MMIFVLAVTPTAAAKDPSTHPTLGHIRTPADARAEMVRLVNKFDLGQSMDQSKVPAEVQVLKKAIDEFQTLRDHLQNIPGAGLNLPIDRWLDLFYYHYRSKTYSATDRAAYLPATIVEKQLATWKPLYSYASIKTKKAKQQQDKLLRRALHHLIGYDNEPHRPLNPVISKRVDCGNHWREHLTIETLPGERVPGYLLLPKKVPLPAPAVIALHQHAGEHRFGADEIIGLAGNQPQAQTYGSELVSRGYVVLALDALTFGQRIDINENALEDKMLIIGRQPLGRIIWDDLRSVQYLLERPEVDPRRIACIGHSLGGTRSTYLAAMEPRIAAVAILCYISDFDSYRRERIDPPPTTRLLGVFRYAEMSDLLALIAPRPLFVLNGKWDRTVPLNGFQRTMTATEQTYRLLQATEALHHELMPEHHAFPPRYHTIVFDWLDSKFHPKAPLSMLAPTPPPDNGSGN